MSDEFADELLALAGESDGVKIHRKRTASGSNKNGSNKRRKQEMVASEDSDMEESDVEDYPLDGKYRDELDRERLLSMPEIKREEILSKRMEEMQKDIERKKLEKMVKSQASGGVMDAASVSKAAKRKHTTIGSTKEKSKTLEALKQKRQAKESRRATKTRDSESPAPRRARSDTPSDMSDSEEGQVHKGSKGSDNSSLDGVQLKTDDKLTLADLNKARITRDMLEKHCFSSHFEEYIKGGWVRLLVGMDNNEMVYRLCEIVDITPDVVEPYKLNEKLVNQNLEMRHGAQTKAFPMHKVSCGIFTQREFDRLIKTLDAEKLKPPTKAKLEKKAEVIHNIDSRIRTDAEVSAMIARAKEVRNTRTAGELFAEKSSLNTHRTLAVKKNDRAEIARLDLLIEKLEAEQNQRSQSQHISNGKSTNGTATPTAQPLPKPVDALTRVNERNRKANLEQMRKADMEMAAKRKREALAGGPVIQDLSARVKTVVKTRFDSRPGTPGIGTPPAAPSPQPAVAAIAAAAPIVPSGLKNSKVDLLAQSVVIDELFF